MFFFYFVFRWQLTTSGGTFLTMERKMHFKFNIWFMFKSESLAMVWTLANFLTLAVNMFLRKAMFKDFFKLLDFI